MVLVTELVADNVVRTVVISAKPNSTFRWRGFLRVPLGSEAGWVHQSGKSSSSRSESESLGTLPRVVFAPAVRKAGLSVDGSTSVSTANTGWEYVSFTVTVVPCQTAYFTHFLFHHLAPSSNDISPVAQKYHVKWGYLRTLLTHSHYTKQYIPLFECTFRFE